MSIEVTKSSGWVQFAVHLQPRASRDEIVGEFQGALKIRVTSPPVDGRANEALCRLLAVRLKVPRAAVRIAGGERSRRKRLEISGVTPDQISDLAK